MAVREASPLSSDALNQRSIGEDAPEAGLRIGTVTGEKEIIQVTTVTPLTRILILPQNKGMIVGGDTKSDTEKSRHEKTEEDPTLLTMMEKILRFWRRVRSSFQRSKSFTTRINLISLSADAVQVEKITDAHAGETKIAEITTL